MGYLKQVIGFMVVGLFVFAMVNFTIIFTENNGGNFTINDSKTQTLYNNLASELSELKNKTEGQKEVLETDRTTGVLEVILNAIRSIGTAFSSIYFVLYNVIFGFIFTILFGSSSAIILGVLGSIITVAIVLYAWKMYKSGDSN